MTKPTILVVEDESIVAKDIQKTLQRLGYDVPAVASSSVTAMEKIEDIKPDLVFLDIKLKGSEDGIQIAEKIKEQYGIPVIFLTSFVDKKTLERAKITEPYGYIVKPFNENDLQTAVEMGLYKYSKDKEVKHSSKQYANTLLSLNEAIIITDNKLNITFMNAKGEELTDTMSGQAMSNNLLKLIKITDRTKKTVDARQLKSRGDEPVWTISEALVTVLKSSEKKTLHITISPIRNEKDEIIGNAFIFRNELAETSSVTEPGEESAIIENVVVQNSFFVKKNSLLVKVYLDNILWIQAMDNYVIIQTSKDQFVIHSTMKDIEAKLPSNQFARIHRSYIVSIDKISVLDENTALIGDKIIPVGKSYKDAFMKKLNFL
ncbi:MAG: response regulator [Bacteroidia bacterium]|nr:response regulator [Bacteroidia bacterium]